MSDRARPSPISNKFFLTLKERCDRSHVCFSLTHCGSAVPPVSSDLLRCYCLLSLIFYSASSIIDGYVWTFILIYSLLIAAFSVHSFGYDRPISLLLSVAPFIFTTIVTLAFCSNLWQGASVHIRGTGDVWLAWRSMLSMSVLTHNVGGSNVPIVLFCYEKVHGDLCRLWNVLSMAGACCGWYWHLPSRGYICASMRVVARKSLKKKIC